MNQFEPNPEYNRPGLVEQPASSFRSDCFTPCLPMSKFAPSFILDRGHHRMSVWLYLNPFRFKWGYHSRGEGAFVASFGFGMITYMRRHYP